MAAPNCAAPLAGGMGIPAQLVAYGAPEGHGSPLSVVCRGFSTMFGVH